MSNFDELNYITENRFYVEIENNNISACFTKCSGLGFKIDTTKQREGGVNDQQRILLGQANFDDVTLSRGATNDPLFWQWIEGVLTLGEKSANDQKTHRRNVKILVFNQAGETMQCWTLVGAVPIAWKAPSLQADGSGVAIEELTLTYEGLKIAHKTGSTAVNGGGATILTQRDALTGYFSGS